MKTTKNQAFRWAATLAASLMVCASAHATLVGYWNFDDNTLAETSGYQPAGTHDGIAVGAIGYTTGVRGSAGALDMRFNQGAVKVKNTDENANAEGNYQNTFNEHLYNSPNGFTIAFWAKDLPSAAWQPWISRNGDGSWGYQVRRTDQNFATFTVRSSDGTDDPTPAGASTDFSDGRWHHIAAVYDPINSVRSVYVDGNPEITIPDGNIGNASGEYLVFGAQNPNAWVTNVFQSYSHCALDEIRIYDNALTQADVQALVGDPWIYVDSNIANMTNGAADIVVPVTVPASLLATGAVEVVVTSPNPSVVVPVGGTGGVLKLEFPMGSANVQNYTLHAVGAGIVTVQHTSTSSWVDGSKSVMVWPAARPADGLVAHWTFDGNSLADSAGYAPAGLHDGTAIGSIGYVSGPNGLGTALVISNTSAVRINNSGGIDRAGAPTFGGDLYNSATGFSIAFWTKNLSSANWGASVSKYGDGGYGYQIRKYGNSGSACFTLRGALGNGDTSGTTTDFSDGKWHHVVAVYDPINFQRLLYVDGVAQINITDGLLDPATIPGQHFLLGGEETDQNNLDQGINYAGNIYLDDVRVYHRALSGPDVMDLYDSISAAPLSLSAISPSPSTNVITISVPASLVATSSVSVTVASDTPTVAAPVGATSGHLTISFPQGGANTATFNVQVNAPGTAHFSYSAVNLTSTVVTTVTVQQPHVNGLVAYWNFNSQTLAETSGFQPAGTHDGIAIGNVAYVPGFNGGYGIDLRQPSTEVRIQNTMLSDPNYRNTFDDFLYGSPNGFTITCWVRGMPLNNWCPWIAKDGEANGYQIREAGSANQLTFTLRNSDGTDDPTSSTGVINDQLWHHLGAVYDPVNGQRTLYIDGVPQITEGDANLTVPPVNSPLFFGGRDLPTGNPFFANVILDEVRVYDTALTQSQIVDQVGAPLIAVGPAILNLNVGDPDTATITLTIPPSLIATSAVSVAVSTANAAVAKPAGASGSSVVVNFPLGGNNVGTVVIHAVGTGSTLFTAASPQAGINGDVTVNVSAAPSMVGHWFSGDASLAETSGFRPAGTHDGMAVGNSPGNLAYSTDVPAGFSGKSLDLTAGNVAVAVKNSASSDSGYLPTYDGLMNTNFTIAFWAKGLPGWWSAWISKDGDENVGYQIRQWDTSGFAAFTIRGTPGPDDAEGNMNLSDTSIWHQYTAVWNGQQGTRQLFIDGILDTGINLTGDTAPFALASSRHFVIGGQEQSGGMANEFAGLIYDVRIYSGPLSAAGIQGLLIPSVAPLPSPVLVVQPRAGKQVRLAWPSAATGFSLQQADALTGQWTAASASVGVEGTNNAAYVNATNNVQFYRLVK